MKRILLGFAAVLVLAAGLGALNVYGRVTALEYEPVAGDVHVIYGMGGNVGVLATERGAVVVDTMTFVSQGRRIRDLAEQLGGGLTEVGFQGTHLRARARSLGAQGVEFQLRLAQDSTIQPGARLNLAVKREHLVLLKD